MSDHLAPVIPLRPKHPHQPPLSYKQLANHLGVSERFIRARVAEGMPCGWDWSGKKRRFKVPEVETWLRENRKKAG